MTTFALKCAAANATSAWQLALDKFPFDLAERTSPRLTTVENNRQVSVKSKRIKEIRDWANHQSTKVEWQAAIGSRMEFFAALERQHGARFRRIPLVNASRLLLHLGRASVLENVGLYCDRTTGLPVIPGSAVKGVISTWACWEGNEDTIYPAAGNGQVQLESNRQQFNPLARSILGDNSANGSDNAGKLVFLGAIPEKPPVLSLDIVTPHHDPRGNDRSPIPNPFLAIESGTAWQFAMLVHPSVATGEVLDLLNTAVGWLKEVLGQSGLGAKTASGFGRFIEIEAWQRARMAPQEKELNDRRNAQIAELKANRIGDYTEEEFTNAVLKRLSKPQEYLALQKEIEKIKSNPGNQPWIGKITEALCGGQMKDVRKKLKEKDWFPTDWLPQ